MLYPASLPQRPRNRFGQQPKTPILPVNKRSSVYKEVKIVQKQKIDMRPQIKNLNTNSQVTKGNGVVVKHVVSSNEISKKQKQIDSTKNNPTSLGNLGNSPQNRNEVLKVSLGEIGKLKNMAKNHQLQGTPRPVHSHVESQKLNSQERPSKNMCFAKKENKETNFLRQSEKKEIHKTEQDEINEKKVDINQSINSRKEKINQLLSRYGKNKDGRFLS